MNNWCHTQSLQDLLLISRHILPQFCMKQGTSFLFFSDALNMSKDVHEALTDVIARYLRDKGEGEFTTL